MRWLALLVFAGCTGGGEHVVVGSKNFTEQRILGELLAQTVESVGLRAERRLDLGGTFVCDAAIRAGQIDAYVEYTGTALTAVLKQAPESDPERVLASRIGPRRRWHLAIGASFRRKESDCPECAAVHRTHEEATSEIGRR